MSLEKFHSTEDVRHSISELKDEKYFLSRQREFLLSQAIPKLEHEYLYSISVLEQEASKLEGELYRLSTIISFYETALQKNVLPENADLTRMLMSLSDQWSEKTLRYKYKSSNDQSIIPILNYERDEIASLFHRILKHISSHALHEGTEHYTLLLRRVSDAYRNGNIGELRALRIIIEGKIASALKKKTSRSLIRVIKEQFKYRFLVLSHKLFPTKIDVKK